MKKRIPINTKNNIHFIDPDDILYCKCNNSSTTIYLRHEESVVVSKGIKAVEELLKGNKFIRPHQSYLVNLDHIELVDKANYKLVLTNQDQIPTAIRKRKEILKIINSGI